MDAYQSVLLGVLQGITEWLPISSQGQTVLVMLQFLRIDPSTALSVAIFLHIGTMLAVLIRFRAVFWSMRDPSSKLLRYIVVATAATGVTGLPFLFFVKRVFEHGELATVLIGVMLLITGLLLGTSRRFGTRYRGLEELRTRDMVIAGLAQGFSILPGISRSGTTIAVLLLQGLEQELALTLSFLMSVPAVLGAMFLFDLPSTVVIAPGNAAVMVVSSLLVGYMTMTALLRFAREVNFAFFCIILGALTIVLAQLPQLF